MAFMRAFWDKDQCQLDKAALHFIGAPIQGLGNLESLVLHASARTPWQPYNHGHTQKYAPSDQVVIPLQPNGPSLSIAGILGPLSLSSTMSYTMEAIYTCGW